MKKTIEELVAEMEAIMKEYSDSPLVDVHKAQLERVIREAHLVGYNEAMQWAISRLNEKMGVVER